MQACCAPHYCEDSFVFAFSIQTADSLSAYMLLSMHHKNTTEVAYSTILRCHYFQHIHDMSAEADEKV